MGNKYKQRAIELLIESTDSFDSETRLRTDVIEAMCQFAEEVEKESFDNRFRMCANQAYTKADVERFLQKQRELCAEKADFVHIFKPNNGIGYTEELIINKDSILNAKLDIDKL